MIGLKKLGWPYLMRKVRAREFEWYPPRLVYAQPLLHKKLKEFFYYRDGRFFEVGANDGLNQSNTAYLEKYLGWSGVLVEPLPTQYGKCVANRPASTVVNAALVSADFSAATIEIAYANLMSTINDPARNLLSIDRHVAIGSQFLRADEKSLSGHKFTVPALTASAVLDQLGETQIDLFSLDVEGYEGEVLKGIDFSRHRPRYFLIEARDKPSVDRYLAGQGYRYEAQWSEQDYLYADAV